MKIFVYLTEDYGTMVSTLTEVIQNNVIYSKLKLSQNQKYKYLLLPVELFIDLDSFGDIGCGDFCLLSDIMGLSGALINGGKTVSSFI